MSNNSPKKHLHTSIEENLYPVININQSVWNPLMTKFRRSISFINPFAHQQIPSQDRIALGPRWGNQFYTSDPYPNGVTFYRMAPSHYDPLDGMNRTSFPLHHRSHGPGSNLLPVLKADKYPRGCVRMIQNFKRCEMVNGIERPLVPISKPVAPISKEDMKNRNAKCSKEKIEILNVCPKWVLEDMVEKQKFKTKVIGIQQKQYNEAMKVSSYNEGGDVSQLAHKTWTDGTREHLRPDTMWADNRYSEITQKEINEAKERHTAREAKKVAHPAEHHHHYDWVEAKRRENAPLYP